MHIHATSQLMSQAQTPLLTMIDTLYQLGCGCGESPHAGAARSGLQRPAATRTDFDLAGAGIGFIISTNPIAKP